MANQMTRLQGIRDRDSRREMVADQQVANNQTPATRSMRPRGQMQQATRRATAAPRLQFTEQAQMNARKAAEVRDLARLALAEKNSDFRHRHADRVFDANQNYRGQQLERLRENDEFNRGMALDNQAMRREQIEYGRERDFISDKRHDDQLLENKRRFELTMDRLKRQDDMAAQRHEDGLLTSQQRREQSAQLFPLQMEGEQAKLDALKQPPKPNQNVTKGREGFYVSALRQAGLDDSEFYDENREFTTKANEVFDTIDALVANGASEQEAIQRAVSQVGVLTTDEVNQADLDARLASDDKKVRRAAQDEQKEIIRENAKLEKKAAEAKAAEAKVNPEVWQSKMSSMVSSIPRASDVGFSNAVTALRDNMDDMTYQGRADVFDALVERGDLTADDENMVVQYGSVAKILDIPWKSSNRNKWPLGSKDRTAGKARGQLLTQIVKTHKISRDKARQMLEAAEMQAAKGYSAAKFIFDKKRDKPDPEQEKVSNITKIAEGLGVTL